MVTSFKLSVQEIYTIGYADALARRSRAKAFSPSLDYEMGYVKGYRDRPDSLFNVAKSPELHNEIGWGDELLNPL